MLRGGMVQYTEQCKKMHGSYEPMEDLSPYPPECINKVLFMRMYTIEGDKQKTLREFPFMIYSSEKSSYIDHFYLSKSEEHKLFPRDFYEEHQSSLFFTMQDSFAELIENDSTYRDTWYNLPHEDLVWASYTLREGIGCDHYLCKCHLRCEECFSALTEADRCVPEKVRSTFYPCRICHDDTVLSHSFTRYDMKYVLCLQCGETVPAARTCDKCGTLFAEYFCNKCNVFSGIGDEAKPNYHCEKCGFCRVGDGSGVTHCDKCNKCFVSKYFEDHDCVLDIGNCIICQEDLNTTINQYILLPCNSHHYAHVYCYETLLAQDFYSCKCPICRKLILYDNEIPEFNRLAELLYITTIQEASLAGYYDYCQCNQCLTRFIAPYHTQATRCANPECLSYNTEVTGEPQTSEDIDGCVTQFEKQQADLRAAELSVLEPAYDDDVASMERAVQFYYSVNAQFSELPSNQVDSPDVIQSFLKRIDANEQQLPYVYLALDLLRIQGVGVETIDSFTFSSYYMNCLAYILHHKQSEEFLDEDESTSDNK